MTEPIKVVADIIAVSLGLKVDQVLLYNQKFKIPPDDRLYVTVSVLGSKTFGASTRYEADPVSDELTEVTYVNRQEIFSILLFSRSNEARTRNWEVPAALVSTYSEQQQEANSIKIAQVPVSMNDLSELEGTSRLNRYVLTIPVLAAYTKRQPVDYYDKFSQPKILTNP
jgi:hypothetical protein